MQVLVPKGQLAFYEEKGLPIDGAFTLKCSELEETEWLALFKLSWMDPEGVLLSRVVQKVKEKVGTYYGIDDLIMATRGDTESEKTVVQAITSRLEMAKSWGLIEKEGTKITDLVKPGKITVIDVSSYRQTGGAEGIKDIVVALVGKKIFEQRMLFRKEEEIKLINENKRTSKMPLVWMLIDEAHMFMPKDEPNIALPILLEWVRVGRQPGLGLMLATQRPERLHPDAISQCDLFISHRMTSQPDIKAVGALRPTYMHTDLDKLYAQMPKQKGFALVIDDNTERGLLLDYLEARAVGHKRDAGSPGLEAVEDPLQRSIKDIITKNRDRLHGWPARCLERYNAAQDGHKFAINAEIALGTEMMKHNEQLGGVDLFKRKDAQGNISLLKQKYHLSTQPTKQSGALPYSGGRALRGTQRGR